MVSIENTYACKFLLIAKVLPLPQVSLFCPDDQVRSALAGGTDMTSARALQPAPFDRLGANGYGAIRPSYSKPTLPFRLSLSKP